MIPTILWLLLDFFSSKIYLNLPLKINKQKNCFQKICFLLDSWRSMTKIAGSGSISQRHVSTDQDPDPHQNVIVRNTEECSILGRLCVDCWAFFGYWARYETLLRRAHFIKSCHLTWVRCYLVEYGTSLFFAFVVVFVFVPVPYLISFCTFMHMLQKYLL